MNTSDLVLAPYDRRIHVSSARVAAKPSTATGSITNAWLVRVSPANAVPAGTVTDRFAAPAADVVKSSGTNGGCT